MLNVRTRGRTTAVRALIAIATLGAIGSFVACLQATQLDGALSSDTTICSPASGSRARFAVLVRHADGLVREDVRQTEGELDRCDSSQGSAYLGAFSLIPESVDARDHTEIVQVMVDTNGGPPELCNDLDENGIAKPTLAANCIVIRRRVRFVHHKALRVPLYLDDRCLGVACAENETCYRKSCVDATAICDVATGTCIREAERANGVDGAGFDPSKGTTPVGADGAIDGALRDGAPNPSLVDGAPNPNDPDARSDAAADAGIVTPPPDTTVKDCDLCGSLKCCSLTSVLTCRTACQVPEIECLPVDAGSSARNCTGAPPPPPPPF